MTISFAIEEKGVQRNVDVVSSNTNLLGDALLRWNGFYQEGWKEGSVWQKVRWQQMNE